MYVTDDIYRLPIDIQPGQRIRLTTNQSAARSIRPTYGRHTIASGTECIVVANPGPGQLGNGAIKVRVAGTDCETWMDFSAVLAAVLD